MIVNVLPCRWCKKRGHCDKHRQLSKSLEEFASVQASIARLEVQLVQVKVSCDEYEAG